VTDPIAGLNAALGDRYVVDRELGRGGMATVYLARDVKHERFVALKTLRPEIAVALGRERFLREIKLAARLQHPNILPVYDSGDAGGTLYYVMPFVEGESLRDRLERGLKSARASEAGISQAAPRGWRARFFPRPGEDAAGATLAALRKGYELGLERLDQTLEEYNAREIPCQGQAFDPRRMNAVERQESSVVPEGTVVEVYRSGYEWNGELFRPAQVKVSCAPAGEEHE